MTKTLYIVICDSWNFHHLDQMNFCHIMIAVCQLSGGELHMNNIWWDGGEEGGGGGGGGVSRFLPSPPLPSPVWPDVRPRPELMLAGTGGALLTLSVPGRAGGTGQSLLKLNLDCHQFLNRRQS